MALQVFMAAECEENEKANNLLDMVDDQLISDVVLLGDQSTTKEFIAERKKVAFERSATIAAMKAFVTKKFAPMMEKAKVAKVSQQKKQKEERDLRNRSARWAEALAAAPAQVV